MKCIKADLPRELTFLELHIIADIHKGDVFSDTRLIKQRIDYIEKTPNAYALLNGDLCNWATKLHKSDPYSESLKPMEQIQAVVDLIQPIKNKTLAITPGNHEYRAYKTEGIDITELACKQLGIENKYSKTGALLFVRFGELSRGNTESNGSGEIRKACYVIYMLHGSGGGRKEGAKAIRLADMACIVDAGIYIHSHTHLPMVMREGYFRVDPRNSAAAFVDKLFVNTGAALDYGGYGEAGEYKPASKETPIIYLNGSKKEYSAKL